MKKYKKLLAIIFSLILPVGSVHNIALAEENTADNSSWAYVQSLIKPEGYEECRSDYEYARYMPESNSYRFVSYYDFRYNHVMLILSDSADWEEVYEKYCAELGFDKADAVEAELYDVPDEGDDMTAPVTVEDKSGKAAAMCAEMYRDGVIEYASYTGIRAYYNSYNISNLLYCDFDGTENELSEIIAGYSDDFSVTSPDTAGGMYSVEFFDIHSLAQLDAVRDSLITDENIVSIYENSDSDLSVKYVSSEVIDLLDNIEAQPDCDMDGNGTVDITDATLVLEYYASSAAGILQTSGEDKMDVNGDGAVDIADATYILTYYAEAAAGLR